MKGTKLDGCPCRTNGPCCTDPDVGAFDHEHSPESVCEDCYASECFNCGAWCACDL